MKKFCKYFFGVLFLVASLCIISSCGEGKKQLKTPQNLRIENEILSWDPVEHAKEYRVKANNMSFKTKEASFDLLETILEPDDYTIRVTAIGDLKKYASSEHSEEIEYAVRSAEGIVAFAAKSGHGACSITGRGAENFVGKLVIPSIIEEGQVKGIAANAFQGCKNLTAVYFPDTVTAIGARAFASCTNLTRVRFPETLSTIRSRVFSDSGLIEVKLPGGITTLDAYAFCDCKALTKLTLSAGYTEGIGGGGTYQGCALEQLEVEEENPVYRSEGNCIIRNEDNTVVLGCKTSVIPQSVTSIAFTAFHYCDGLTEISIPADVTKIIGNPFQRANNLERIEVAAGNLVYRSEGNCVIHKGDNTVIAGCKTSVIPEGVNAIGRKAFAYLSSLTSIEIPDSVTEIGYSAFEGCTGLTELTIGDGVTEIGHYAFYGCTGLTELTISDSVTTIGDCAFSGCRGLSVITIPSSVRTIGRQAFRDCFASIIVPASAQSTIMDAFFNNRVYTDAEIYSVEWADYSETFIYGCEFGYDGAYPYVISWKYRLLPPPIPLPHYLKMGIGPGGNLVPGRAGYEFAGWATEKDGEVVYAPYKIKVTYGVASGAGRPSSSTEKFSKQMTVAIYGDDEFNSLALDTVLYAVWRPLQ